MSKAIELCEKVLAFSARLEPFDLTGEQLMELANAAPLLAKMLLKAIEQRDNLQVEFCNSVVQCQLDIQRDNAELDRIAESETEGCSCTQGGKCEDKE